jgi:hypothetical protein
LRAVTSRPDLLPAPAPAPHSGQVAKIASSRAETAAVAASLFSRQAEALR